MGRKKKLIELKQIGSVENKKPKIMKAGLLTNVEKKDDKASEQSKSDEKNMKKWEKLIINTYNQKMKIDTSMIYQKLIEKFSNEEEVKNIISEMSIKIKDFDYLIKKQWKILKKFNLQEKMFREENKVLAQIEKQKLNDIYKSTIEKLTASHISGFEPPNVIKSRIYAKLQSKYSIPEKKLKELQAHFKTTPEEEEETLNNRYETQVNALKQLVTNNTFMSNKEMDKNTNMLIKQELKRYEKELELKAGKGTMIDDQEGILNILDEKKTDGTEHLLLKAPSHEENVEMPGSMIQKEEQEYKDEPMNIEEFDGPVRMKDILANWCCIGDNENQVIGSFKESIINELKDKLGWNSNSNSVVHEASGLKSNAVYKSKILNDLNTKMIYNNKLTSLDIQILIYLSHFVVNELNNAKMNNRPQQSLINPEELITFLKKLKNDYQNSSCLSLESKIISSMENTNMNVNANANAKDSHSIIHSQYSNFSEEN